MAEEHYNHAIQLRPDDIDESTENPSTAATTIPVQQRTRRGKTSTILSKKNQLIANIQHYMTNALPKSNPVISEISNLLQNTISNNDSSHILACKFTLLAAKYELDIRSIQKNLTEEIDQLGDIEKAEKLITPLIEQFTTQHLENKFQVIAEISQLMAQSNSNSAPTIFLVTQFILLAAKHQLDISSIQGFFDAELDKINSRQKATTLLAPLLKGFIATTKYAYEQKRVAEIIEQSTTQADPSRFLICQFMLLATESKLELDPIREFLNSQLKKLPSLQKISDLLMPIIEKIKDAATAQQDDEKSDNKAIIKQLDLTALDLNEDSKLAYLLGALFYLQRKYAPRTLSDYQPLLEILAEVKSNTDPKIPRLILFTQITQIIFRRAKLLAKLADTAEYHRKGISYYMHFLNNMSKLMAEKFDLINIEENFKEAIGLVIFTCNHKEKRHKNQLMPIKKHSDFAAYLKKKWVKVLLETANLLNITTTEEEYLKAFTDTYASTLPVIKLGLQLKLDNYNFNKIYNALMTIPTAEGYEHKDAARLKEFKTAELSIFDDIAAISTKVMNKKQAAKMLAWFMVAIEQKHIWRHTAEKPLMPSNNQALPNSDSLEGARYAYRAISVLLAQLKAVKEKKNNAKAIKKGQSAFVASITEILSDASSPSLTDGYLDSDEQENHEAYKQYVKKLKDCQQSIKSQNEEDKNMEILLSS